jgi:hypothetical protein
VQTTHQPRSNVADQLERLTPRFDQLTYRARLGPLTPPLYHELEAEAQALAADLIAAFRGRPRRFNPPLVVSEDGNSAGW